MEMRTTESKERITVIGKKKGVYRKIHVQPGKKFQKNGQRGVKRGFREPDYRGISSSRKEKQ